MKQKNLIFLPKGKWAKMLLSLVLLMVLMTGLSFAQQKTVKGKITDEAGLVVPGASKTLVVSFIGMKTQELTIGNQTNFAVQLIGETIGLEEVVAIGYGVQRKKLNTGATVQVKGEDIQKMNTVSPMTAMQSQTPGVNITKTSGEPGAGFKVNIRGIGTIGNSQPLYIVDGIPRGDINYLSTSDIESIEIFLII